VSFDLEEIRESELARLSAIPNHRNIAAVGPIVLGVASAESRRMLLAGVDFKAAAILKPWWRVEGRLPQDGEVLLGAEAAQALGLAAGQRLSVNGRSLVVSGRLDLTGSQDDQLAFLTLPTAQKLFDKPGRISMVEVAALCKDCPIEDMVRQIAAVLPSAKVMAIQQVVKSRLEALAQFRKFSYGICAVILCIGVLVVLVTMMGSVRERTQEIGIFRAVGFRRSHILQIVFLEAGIISVLAGVLGYVAGWASAAAALALFGDGHSGHVPFAPGLAAGSVALALALGLIATVYPAQMGARLDPNEALRAL